jgi:hypothetical protein
VSFFERFFALYYPGAGYKSSVSVSLLGIVQGMYVAGLAPFLITYPVLFMSIAGVIRMVDSRDDSTRVHLVISLLAIGLASFLAALLLYAFEIPRNVIYIYPFIIIAAAAGVHFSLQKRTKVFILSAIGMVILIVAIEHSILASGNAITSGVVPAPDQYAYTLLSLSFLAGVAIVCWKVFEVEEPVLLLPKRNWKATSRVTGPIVVIAIICLISFSQFSVFAQTSPYRSSSDFSGLSDWLDHHVQPGDVILTNGNFTVMSLANDTTLRLIDQGIVRVLPIPDNSTALVQLTKSSAYDYLIVIKQGQYTYSGSYSPQLFMENNQLVETLVNTTIANIQTPSA